MIADPQKACTEIIRWRPRLFHEVPVRAAIAGLPFFSAGKDYFALLCVLEFDVDLGIRVENSLACQGKGLPGYAGIRRVIENKIGLALSDWSSPPVQANFLTIGYTAEQSGQIALYGWLFDVSQPDEQKDRDEQVHNSNSRTARTD